MPLHWRGFFLSQFLAAPSKTIAIFAGFFARGIEAEPLAQREAQASDGADSPTQGAERAEAARPNKYFPPISSYFIFHTSYFIFHTL